MRKLSFFFMLAFACQLHIFANGYNLLQEKDNPVNVADVKNNLQLSKNELVQISTKELLEICLDYPYIIDCLFYDTPQDGVKTLISEFNGFPELLSRNDAIDCLLSKLQSFPNEIRNVQDSTNIYKGLLSLKFYVLEMLLSQESVISKLSNEQQNRLMSVMETNLSVKNKYPKIFGSMSKLPYSLIEKQLSEKSSSLKSLSYSATPATIYTPMGSIVPDTYSISGDDFSFTDSELAAMQNSLTNNYDGAILIAPPSIKYNCHAYAWHMSENGSQVWIGYYTTTAENIYWNDGSYIEVPESLATKVSYDENTANHSAIRINSTWYQSKWGQGPLVKHHPNACPYNTTYPKKYYKRNSSITGSSYVYNLATYTVNNIANGATVTWSLTGTNASCFTLVPNVPSSSQCQISRNENAELSGSSNLTLTAHIVYNGVIIETLSKQIITPYISGPTIPCGYTTYVVENRPSNSTIEWSTTGTNMEYDTDPQGLLPDDTTAYVIINEANEIIYGTLTATVKVNNQIVGTLNKRVDTSGYFSGTWYQTTNPTPQTFYNNSIIAISGGGQYNFCSDDFIGANITYTQSGGIILNNWTHSNNTITFSLMMPVFNNGGLVKIQGVDPYSCKKFSFRLLILASLDPILLSVSQSNQTCQISLHNEHLLSESDAQAYDSSTEKWQLAIMEYESGNIVFETETNNETISIGTNDWKGGVYIATALIGGKQLACKFVVTK